MAKRKTFTVTTVDGVVGTRSTFNAAGQLAVEALHAYGVANGLVGEWTRTKATINKADGFTASSGVREWTHTSGAVFTAVINLEV